MKYKQAIVPDELSRAMNNRGRDYVRELARQRDKRTCQMCGKKWQVGMRRFDIHHIYECGMKSQGSDRIRDLDGLITYCHRCHMNVDVVVKKMSTKTGNFKNSPQAMRHPFYRRKAEASAVEQ